MSFPLPTMSPCYLCQIVEGKAEPWNVIEHAELTMTILNGRQFEIGQCMVLPLRHAPTLLDLTPPEEAAIMAAAKRVTRVMAKAFEPDGVLLYQNNGTGSGQEVPHFHLHVVPRCSDSDWGFGPPHIAKLENARRGVHLDHAVVTDQTRETVARLRRHFEER